MIDCKDIAGRLVTARGEIISEEWARQLGLSLDETMKIETGEIAPSLECLLNIHRLTGLSLDWLITGHSPETPLGPDAPKRKFSDLSLAQLAASLLNDTSLPKHEREIIGDLIVAAVTHPQIRAALIRHYRFLNFTGPAAR